MMEGDSPFITVLKKGLPPAVRRTRRRTLLDDAEMFNQFLMCNGIVCKCLAIKNTKRGQGWPIFKKYSVEKRALTMKNHLSLENSDGRSKNTSYCYDG